MADDPRDRYVPKHPTPPGGTRERAADNRQPISKPDFAQEEYTDVGEPGSPAATDRKTPPGIAIARTISDTDMIERTMRRAGETKNIAIDTKKAAATTLDRVESLRKEANQRIEKVDDKVEKLDAKVDGVIRVVGNVREEVGRQGGQNTLIISMLEDIQDDRQRTEHVKTTHRLAEVEVDKSRRLTDVEIERTRALTEIEESKADKALRRKIAEQLVVKVLAAVGVVWAVISAYFLAR